MDIYDFAEKFIEDNKEFGIYMIDTKFGEVVRDSNRENIFYISWYGRNGCIEEMSIKNAINDIRDYEKKYGVKFKY
jgi:hypothetical protein